MFASWCFRLGIPRWCFRLYKPKKQGGEIPLRVNEHGDLQVNFQNLKKRKNHFLAQTSRSLMPYANIDEPDLWKGPYRKSRCS